MSFANAQPTSRSSRSASTSYGNDDRTPAHARRGRHLRRSRASCASRASPSGRARGRGAGHQRHDRDPDSAPATCRRSSRSPASRASRFGGAGGFQLQDLRVNGFALFGADDRRRRPRRRSTQLRPVEADLAGPFPARTSRHVLQRRRRSRYIDVFFRDPTSSGIDRDSITDDERTSSSSSGAAAPTWPSTARRSRSAPNVYRFPLQERSTRRPAVQGRRRRRPAQHGRGRVPRRLVPRHPRRDEQGARPRASTSTVASGFALSASRTTPPPRRSRREAREPVRRRDAEPALGQLAARTIDVIFTAGDGRQDRRHQRRRDPAHRPRRANLALDGSACAELGAPGADRAEDVPLLRHAEARRRARADLGVNGTVDVEFVGAAAASTAHRRDLVQVAQTSNATSCGGVTDEADMAGPRASASFTVDRRCRTPRRPRAPTAIGPLTLTNPPIGLVGTTFKDGKLVADDRHRRRQRATLAFGGSSPRPPAPARRAPADRSSGISAKLTGILGTFDVRVDIAQGRRRDRQPGRAARRVRRARQVHLDVATLLGDGPERRRRSPAAGIKRRLRPELRPGEERGKPQEILRVNNASIEFPRFGITGVIRAGHRTTERRRPSRASIVTTNGFALGRAELRYKPGQRRDATPSPPPDTPPASRRRSRHRRQPRRRPTIRFGWILEFDDLRIGVTDFEVTFGARRRLRRHDLLRLRRRASSCPASRSSATITDRLTRRAGRDRAGRPTPRPCARRSSSRTARSRRSGSRPTR